MNTAIAQADPHDPKAPIVERVDNDTWWVTFGQHRARVVRTTVIRERWYGKETTTYALYVDRVTVFGRDDWEAATVVLPEHPTRKIEVAFQVAADYFNAVDDMLVMLDEWQTLGGSGPLGKLNPKRTKALTEALAALGNGGGFVPVQDWVGVFGLLIPGVGVFFRGRTHADQPIGRRNYLVGDDCVVDSYNLDYMGKVVQVTEDYVWARYDVIRGQKKKRHTLHSFWLFNTKTPTETREYNKRERMYL